MDTRKRIDLEQVLHKLTAELKAKCPDIDSVVLGKEINIRNVKNSYVLEYDGRVVVNNVRDMIYILNRWEDVLLAFVEDQKFADEQVDVLLQKFSK